MHFEQKKLYVQIHGGGTAWSVVGAVSPQTLQQINRDVSSGIVHCP